MQTPAPEEDHRNLDPWSRLRRRIAQIINEAADEIVRGTCTPEMYHRLCGEHAIAREIFELMEEVGRGQDVRPVPTTRGFNPRSIEDC